jgi:hypothetical protein
MAIANGRNNKEIGAVLDISEATVKGHVRSILAKLEAIGRTKAIAIAAKRGLIRANTRRRERFQVLTLAIGRFLVRIYLLMGKARLVYLQVYQVLHSFG